MSSKKQTGMVFHQATTTAATPAADHPTMCFVVPKPGKASEARMEQATCVIDEETDMMGKPNMCLSKEAIKTSDGLTALKHLTSSNTQLDILSPYSTCKGIRVTLDNNSMWNEFFRCRTEMILTKQGSRMFPYCRFRISGLQPSRKYSLIMDIQPLDNCGYKWTGKSWQVAGKAEGHVKSQPFAHPESPSTGQHWMQNPVSFYKLKLTNNISDEENTILHPMHRYLPRLHVVQTDKAAKDIKLSGPSVVTFTFPQTEFMAVTAYQNTQFAQLKVDYNPFAKGLKEDVSNSWGLKLKLNSGKDLHKDGGTTNSKQHPVKKNLKSLLANHKPRSSKVAYSNPLVSVDLQKDSTINKDQSAAKVPEESLCNSSSRPAQKLFSELIREAHVSLHRCNLEQLSVDNSTELINTKTTALNSKKDIRQKDSTCDKAHSKRSSVKRSETPLTKRKSKGRKGILNSPDSKDNVRTDSSEVGNVAAPVVDSDHPPKPEGQSEVSVKQHKRPAPLPLPALALFLKQHSTKSKKVKNKSDSPPTRLPSQTLSGSQSPAAAAEPQSPGHSSSGASGIIKSYSETSGPPANIDSGEMVLNVTGPTGEIAFQPSSPACLDTVLTPEPKFARTDDCLNPISVAESSAAPDVTLGLPNSDQPYCSLGTSTSTISSTLATSSSSPVLSRSLDIVLPVPNSPQMTVTESSTLPSDPPTIKSHSLLPDSECCSFSFVPLSPACSPEPLPPLPDSLALDLNCSTSEPTPKVITTEDLPPSEHSAASVFKWHTVLPPSEPYIDDSFATFQSTSQTLPLTSITSPLLPSPTASQPEPQSIDASTETPPPGPPPPFQENEQSLPFPAELSPLALQLPLSPTFSSLDGDGLSPPPSIADLVHFFSTDEDLGMGVDFPNTDAVAVTCPPPTTAEANALEPSQEVLPAQPSKPCKRKSRRRRLPQTPVDQKTDDSTYIKMQPNLEEVEEQLFISFTSKEALKLHIADSSEETVTQPQTTSEGHPTQPQMTPGHLIEPQTTPEGHLTQSTDAPENAENLEQKISTCETILLRDLKLMKHRQVIHPVLQEVGLKMNLLDSTLAIDLQYLGVRLPIPPPGESLEPLTQELLPTQGATTVFVSRTGKTTDMTQIKGWRDKFSPPEAPPTSSSAGPEAGLGLDVQKKNLSAFCSDMLDEYLENEGKLIDERAASFSQPLVEPLVYELPTRSSSYVRTLDSVLKKHDVGSPTSDLISGFVPPSKRPKLSLKEMKISRKGERKQRGPKQTRFRIEPAVAPVPAPEPGPAEPNVVPTQPAVLTPGPAPSKLTRLLSEHQKSRRKQLKLRPDHSEPLTLSAFNPAFKRRRKLKLKTLSQTLSVPRSTEPPQDITDDLAPLESDSELGGGADQGVDAHKDRGTAMTRALLRQKDLEDGVVWEGRSRTSITEERAAIALTSLFTLMGFVSENPTAPIQLVRRRAPPCLNECCRLGCVCSSLSHLSRVSHCGRPSCMFGCSCLKQKVVLLKNLDGSDSSPSHHGNTQKRRRRRRRMKMAYILKEADSVSQPAERVRVLWRRNSEDPDPEPIHVPETATPTQSRESNSSCARVRGFRGKRRSQKPQMRAGPQVDSTKNKSKRVCLKSLSHTEQILKYKATPTSSPQADEPPPHPPIPDPSSSPLPMNPAPKPSKRLIILAECKWASDGDRNHVLKRLCEAMAQDRLDGPFWIRKYLISPLSQTVEQSGADRCIQYKIHISRPPVEREGPAAAARPRPGVQKKKPEPPQGGGVEVCPQSQVKKEAEGWQQEGAEPLEDWQREVDDVDVQEEEGSTPHRLHDRTGRRRWKNRTGAERGEKKKKRRMVTMALPFLIGISPAGFLSANRKQPGGTDHLVQVNGKLYPLAKVQLGRMGALHPANRLAAYLTGRVGSNRKPQGSSSSCQPAEIQNSGPPSTAPSTPDLNDPTTTKPTRPITVVTLPTSATDSQVSRSVSQPVDPPPGPVAPEGSQLMLQAPPPHVNIPVLSRSGPHPGAPPPSAGQRVLLQLVQTSSGMQCYRRADGKLVQLIPISHLRPGGGTPVTVSPSVVTVNQAPQTSGARSSSSFLSVPPLPGPRSPTSAILSQKGLSTLKVLPPSTKDPIFISCPPPSPRRVLKVGGSICLHPRVAPVKLISLAPSVGQGAELGVKTVVMSAVPKKPATLQTLPTSQSPTHTVLPPLQPTGSEVTTVPPPHTPTEPELARDLVDLDIICVDDENEPVNTETRSSEVVDLLGSSSGETDNSSDFEDESSSEEETARGGDTNEHVQRDLHNQLERKRRSRMLQLFDALRREVGLSLHKTSKISTLNKAVQVIQDLRVTESGLQKRKRRLMKRREKFLSTLAPPSEKRESRDKTGPGPGPDPGPGPGPGPEVLDLSDELTEDSHLEEGEEPYIVSVETSQLDAAQRRMKSKEVDSNSSSETSPLQQACQQTWTLQTEEQRPKTLLTPQKDSGRSEQSVLRKLQQEERLQETHKGDGSSVTTPAVGGASDTPTKDRADEDIQIMSSYLLLPQAPPTPVSTPPTTTAVHQSQKVMLMSKSVPPPLPAVSHHAPVTRERTRTIPNILSRSKIPAAASLHSEGEARPLRALVPTEVLSLVGAALPGRPVMTLSPLMSGSTVLQPSSSPGMAAVTLNIPSLVNQKIHLTPQPCPPIGNIYSSSAPFTVTNLSASNLNHVLHLVHPATQQQLPQLQHQQQTAPPSQSDPDQTNVRPVPSPPAPSLRTSGDGQVGVSGGGAKGAESESLSSLLNEIVFLNQQTVPTATAAKVLSVTDTAVGGAKEQSHAHTPQVSECTSATETEEAGLQGPEEAAQTGPQPGPPSDNTKDGNLAPPPLLQMKVGGVTVAAPTNSGTAVTAGRSGAQVKGEGGVAWRPMPRLVPLGLRGNPPS